ncbi:hypothetical protein LN050_04030 [Comamonadaceae bacterium M7527]|nr:hypothetical protein LN050_04030 [Comamonadaceae bacterium M7527]
MDTHNNSPRTPRAHNSFGSHQQPRHTLPTCVALVDARFLAWLTGAGSGKANYNRNAVSALLSQALPAAGVYAQLVRTYWYSELDDNALVDDQCLRLVAADMADEGGPVLAAMLRDLEALSTNNACVHVLIASDDERLIGAIDAARLRGVRVHLLCDESVHQFYKLQQSDPDWSRLLRAADRRVVVTSSELSAAMGEGRSHSHSQSRVDHAQPAGDARVTMQAVVDAWWDKSDSYERDDLKELVPQSRGLPQEIDRSLLAAGRDALHRPLTTGERHLLRQMARDRVLGEHTAPVATQATDAHA